MTAGTISLLEGDAGVLAFIERPNLGLCRVHLYADRGEAVANLGHLFAEGTADALRASPLPSCGVAGAVDVPQPKTLLSSYWLPFRPELVH